MEYLANWGYKDSYDDSSMALSLALSALALLAIGLVLGYLLAGGRISGKSPRKPKKK